MSPEAPLVLIVEDEPEMRRFLRALLESHGMRYLETTSGEEGLRALEAKSPDVVLLDLGLPDLDGLDATRRVREWSRVPIVVISARGREEDKVRALDLGADDYVTKPFGAHELLARIRAVLRRALTEHDPPVVTMGAVEVDRARRRVRVSGTEVRLTPTEWRMLAYMLSREGRVLTHREILRAVWGPGNESRIHYVRVYMAELRRKLEHDPARPRHLVTETGVGYRLRLHEP